jgi:hypothetical protein
LKAEVDNGKQYERAWNDQSYSQAKGATRG